MAAKSIRFHRSHLEEAKNYLRIPQSTWKPSEASLARECLCGFSSVLYWNTGARAAGQKERKNPCKPSKRADPTRRDDSLEGLRVKSIKCFTNFLSLFRLVF